MSLNTDTGKKRESGWWETVKIVIQALALAMIVRVFFYQPFNIPSGSMKSVMLMSCGFASITQMNGALSWFLVLEINTPLSGVNESVPIRSLTPAR